MSVVTVTTETRASIIAQAARSLLQGGVVVLPTDTVYGLAAHPAQAGAVARLYAIKRRPAGKPLALLAADMAAAESYGALLPPSARRMADAFWPGALTLVVDRNGSTEGIRVPAHPLSREVLAACGGVLRVTSANLSGGPPALSAAEALREVGPAADLVIDDGPAPGGVPSSVVRITATGWELLRSGAIPLELLRQAAERGENTILFVCSGNVCRSPMAEALLNTDLDARAMWRAQSAGTQALAGQPASADAIRALAEIGIDLTPHRSRLLTLPIIEAATMIVPMTRQHHDILLAWRPAARDKIFLLRHFDGRRRDDDLDDPIGGTLDTYRACRDAIKACLPELIAFLRVLE